MVAHRPGVIGGQRQPQVPAVAVEEVPQVAHATFDVLTRFKRAPDATQACGRRHELHQAKRALRRHGLRHKVRFRPDHRLHQRRINVVPERDLIDQLVVRLAPRPVDAAQPANLPSADVRQVVLILWLGRRVREVQAAPRVAVHVDVGARGGSPRAYDQ
jgi:hypothetical protein